MRLAKIGSRAEAGAETLGEEVARVCVVDPVIPSCVRTLFASLSKPH